MRRDGGTCGDDIDTPDTTMPGIVCLRHWWRKFNRFLLLPTMLNSVLAYTPTMVALFPVDLPRFPYFTRGKVCLAIHNSVHRLNRTTMPWIEPGLSGDTGRAFRNSMIYKRNLWSRKLECDLNIISKIRCRTIWDENEPVLTKKNEQFLNIYVEQYFVVVLQTFTNITH